MDQIQEIQVLLNQLPVDTEIATEVIKAFSRWLISNAEVISDINDKSKHDVYDVDDFINSLLRDEEEHKIKCQDCGISIPDPPEDAPFEALMCDSCLDVLEMIETAKSLIRIHQEETNA